MNELQYIFLLKSIYQGRMSLPYKWKQEIFKGMMIAKTTFFNDPL